MIIKLIDVERSFSVYSFKALIKCDYCGKEKIEYVGKNQKNHYCSKPCFILSRHIVKGGVLN